MNEILKFDLGSELNFCIEMEFAKEESFPYKKLCKLQCNEISNKNISFDVFRWNTSN